MVDEKVETKEELTNRLLKRLGTFQYTATESENDGSNRVIFSTALKDGSTAESRQALEEPLSELVLDLDRDAEKK